MQQKAHATRVIAHGIKKSYAWGGANEAWELHEADLIPLPLTHLKILNSLRWPIHLDGGSRKTVIEIIYKLGCGLPSLGFAF
jgi:hypothetical protein